MKPVFDCVPRPLRQNIVRRIYDREEASQIVVGDSESLHVDFLVRVDDLVA